MTVDPQFRPGFRLSKLDVGILIAGTGFSILTARVDGSMGFCVAFVVAHFFLFCNVLRMPPRLELCWATSFVLLSASCILRGTPTWGQAFAIAVVVTVALAIVQTRRPSYHGVFWQRLNPQLPQWWDRNGNRPH